MKNAAQRLLNAALDLYRAYPSRSNAYIASAVVFVGGLFGVMVDQQSVLTDVALVAPILLSGEITHRKVRPVRRHR